MDHTGEIVVKALGFVALAWIVVSISGSWPIYFLRRATLQPLSAEKARRCMEIVLSSGAVDLQWAEQNGFEPTGAFHVTNAGGLVDIVGWTKQGEATYLCAQVIAKSRVEIEIVSTNGDLALTSTTAKDAHLFPSRPGSWMQQLHVSSAEELWPYHEEALAYLRQTAGLRMEKTTPDLTNDFARGMRKGCDYVRSIPLWQLRVPYWYVGRRLTRRNKTVRQFLET